MVNLQHLSQYPASGANMFGPQVIAEDKREKGAAARAEGSGSTMSEELVEEAEGG
jgi:hypothetical protein